MSQKNYSNFDSASASNYDLLRDLFTNSKHFKLIKPQRIDSTFDGILMTKKDGKDVCILIEVKRRAFTAATLHNEYEDTLFLEKRKYASLHKYAKQYASPGRIIKIWYLSKTDDGLVYVHDLTDKDFNWISVRMNAVTYVDDIQKKDKKVALLNIADAIIGRQTNILH